MAGTSTTKIVACVALAAFNFQVDAQAINVALPSIAGYFSVATAEAAFLTLAYLLTATSVFLPVGWAASRWGLDRMFCAGCWVMLAGTVLCAISNDFFLLVASRAVQGGGAGTIAAIGYAMIPAYLPSEAVPGGYRWLSTAAGAGMVAGGPLGGWLSEFLSWQGIFGAVAIPIAAIALFASACLPPDPQRSRKCGGRKSFRGALLLAAGISFAICGLTFRHEWGWLSAQTCLLMLAGATSLLFAFQKREGYEALISGGLRDNRAYMASLLTVFAITATTGGYAFVLPFYLTLVCGLSPSVVSMALLAGSISFIGGAQGGRLLVGRGLGQDVIRACLLAMAGCSAVYALVLTFGGLTISLLFWAAFGLASGLAVPLNTARGMQSVREEDRNEAGTLLPLILNLGTTVGVSLFETVFSWRVPQSLAHGGGTEIAGFLLAGAQMAFLLGAALLAGVAWRTGAKNRMTLRTGDS